MERFLVIDVVIFCQIIECCSFSEETPSLLTKSLRQLQAKHSVVALCQKLVAEKWINYEE